MSEIKIWVHDIRTGERIKPSKYNTFWDEKGNLQGMQDYFKIVYAIELSENDQCTM